MPFDFSVTFEESLNRLAGESILAGTGRDEGLIPAYSLLGEMAEESEGQPELQARLLEVRSRLEALLDAARPFDEAALRAVRELVEWLQAPAEAAGEGAVSAEPAVDVLLDLHLTENAELLAEFHAEAGEHLSQVESSLLILDERPDDRDALDQLFRSFHTIKGVSGFLQLTPMHMLTHEVESLMDLARNRRLRITPEIVTAVLQSRDAVQEMVGQIMAALEQGRMPEKIVPVSHLIRTVRALAVEEGAPAATEDETAASSPSAATEPAMQPAVPAPAPAAAGVPAEGRGLTSASSVRVNTDKLDALMNVVGELVIVQSQITESGREVADDNSPLARNIAQLSRITKELQHTSMSLRLMPVKPTFQKMERLARDLARDFGKKVAFHTEGDDTEVDRTVVEEIADPLVHMVRNSMDHGFEPPAERAASGKPEQGTLSLKAYNQGSHIIIELADDGRGMDAEAIHRKAIEKRVVGPGDALTRDEKLQLIFAPGFSTAAQVTAISGRGVGMDVVKRNIERLRGQVEIATEAKRGTTFRIRLPLTTAIIDGLIVRVGEDRFILPSTSVQMALRPARNAISTVHGRGELLEHRGRIVPVRRLHRQFAIASAIDRIEDGIIVIMETQERITALLVDELMGKQEVVVKNLGGFLANLPGIAGGAILGDGNIALILDPASLTAA